MLYIIRHPASDCFHHHRQQKLCHSCTAQFIIITLHLRKMWSNVYVWRCIRRRHQWKTLLVTVEAPQLNMDVALGAISRDSQTKLIRNRLTDTLRLGLWGTKQGLGVRGESLVDWICWRLKGRQRDKTLARMEPVMPTFPRFGVRDWNKLLFTRGQ